MPHPGRVESLLQSAVARGWIPFDWVGPWIRADFRAVRRQAEPRTFTQKVCHKLVHDRRPIARIYADKFAVREYVRARCPSVRLPRLLASFDHEDEAVAGQPAGPWVMKASHGSGMVLICQRPGAIPAAEVQAHARRWLRRDYAVRFWEWQYLRLPRRILFEEYLGTGPRTPDEYKFYVMNRKVCFIEVNRERFVRHTRDFFWADWTPIESRIGPAPVAAVRPPRPPTLERMIGFAETLAAETDFLRVDLYAIDGEIYFSELTHSPAAGAFDFADPELDARLGACWTLPPRARAGWQPLFGSRRGPARTLPPPKTAGQTASATS